MYVFRLKYSIWFNSGCRFDKRIAFELPIFKIIIAGLLRKHWQGNGLGGRERFADGRHGYIDRAGIACNHSDETLGFCAGPLSHSIPLDKL